MKTLSFVFITFIGALLSGTAEAATPIDGHWFYYKKVYRGQEMPEGPDATLRMHYEFDANGDSHLYWWHEGQDDHCRRRGRFSLEDNQIVDEVVWLDPNNTPFCSQDPDMRLGRKTRTPYYFYGNDLALGFNLGDEKLDLIWKRIEETEK